MKTKPVLRSHRLTIATTKAKAFFGNFFKEVDFFGWVSRGWLVTPSYLWHLFVCYLHYIEVNLTLTLVTYQQKNLH